MSPAKPIPDNYPNLFPYIVVDPATSAIDFYTTVFAATEVVRIPTPDGRVAHAELQLGDSMLMLADESPEVGFSPRKYGGSAVTLNVFVENVDDVFANALQHGAKALEPVQDRFFGHRTGLIEDPFGHQWSIQTHIEDMSNEEMVRRATGAMGT